MSKKVITAYEKKLAGNLQGQRVYAKGNFTEDVADSGRLSGARVKPGVKFIGLASRKPMKTNTASKAQAERRKAILDHAVKYFQGNAAAAERWVKTPARFLEEKRPIDMATSGKGTERVHLLLNRLEYGIYT